MTLEDLHRTAAEGFRNVDERFAAHEKRFDGIDQRFDEIDQRFDEIDQRFDGIDQRFDGIDQRFDRLEARFGSALQELRSDLEARIIEEAATTRRYFDVMVERVEAAVRIVAEGHGHLGTVVDNHESRLQTLEKPS